MTKLLLATLFFIPYFGAYVLSHALHIPGRENMPTILEWFEGALDNE